MAKYIFTSDYLSSSTQNQSLQLINPSAVEIKKQFKVGDIIDATMIDAGTIITNPDGSLPAITFGSPEEVSKAKEWLATHIVFAIPFGGGVYSPVKEYTGTGAISIAINGLDTPVFNPNGPGLDAFMNSNLINNPVNSKSSFFTPKNIIIGLVIIGAIVLIIKYLK